MKKNFFEKQDNLRYEYYKKEYVKNNRSWQDIAEELDTYPNKVRRDATKLGIESRDKSLAQKLALSNGRSMHPTKGKKQSDFTKIKISESQGKVWDGMSDQEREYRSKIGLDSWNKKSEYERSEFFKKSVEAIQEASKHGSKMEKFIFDFLVEEGYRVDKHKEQVLQNEKFHIDLYLPSCRMAIEIDGPMHFEPVFGEEKLQKRQAADTQKNGLILSSGMVLVRVKLSKRESQRYMRNTAGRLLKIIKSVENKFPKTMQERYFEI